MNSGLFKKLLPHLIAIVVFLIVSIIFCKPALEGKVLQTSDNVGADGMSQSSKEYAKEYGHYPGWNTHLFSGMPGYQVLVDAPSVLLDFNRMFQLYLPKPINYFYLACICFYILCLAFSINPYVSIFAALAYAFNTYDPAIISAGHDTKMLALAYAPGLLAGLALIYEKKYWIGIAALSFFAVLEVLANHPQVNFYLLICAIAMSISYLIQWVKRKNWKHMTIAFSLAALGAIVGVGNAAVILLPTYDYSKFTIRGGKTIENTATGVVETKTTGLDLDYAFRYSLRKSEVVTLLMPNAFGSSSAETFEEDSKLISELVDRNIPEGSATQLAAQLPKYWGGMSSPGEYLAGPVYAGAITCLLFILGLILLKTHHRWWILGATLFAFFLAWGKFFPGFNIFLFEHLPLYNKFRAPSMALVIPQLLIPLLAALTVQNVFFSKENTATDRRFFKNILYGFGGLIVLLGLVYLLNDYSSGYDEQIRSAYSSQPDTGKLIINSLIEARKSMFGSGILRVMGYSLLVLGAIYLWKKKVIPPLMVAIIFLLVNTIDLGFIGKKYLNDEIYIDRDEYVQHNFNITPADQQILDDEKDEPAHFRVYNLSPDRFNESRTSYFHRSVGGYHPAKLRIYQDIIENQLSKDTLNMAVLNMLDTRYFLIPDRQTGMPSNVQRNDSALGAAWFVKQVQAVNGPGAEMKALNNFDPKQTAFIDTRTQPVTIKQPVWDTTAKVTLVHYNNDTIIYKSKATSEQFAVFSEIYYPHGWNAYIDEKKAEHYKVDYALRGMTIPAGDHTITFRFEPVSHRIGYAISFWTGIVFYLLLLGGLFMTLYKGGHIGFTKKTAS